MEGAITLHGMWQKRCSWLSGLSLGRVRWIMRRTVNLGLACVGAFLSMRLDIERIDWTLTMDDIPATYSEEKSAALSVCGGFFLIRLFSLLLVTRGTPHPFL